MRTCEGPSRGAGNTYAVHQLFCEFSSEVRKSFSTSNFRRREQSKLPGEHIATRETPARDGKDPRWKKDATRVICFGVYGFEAPEE